MTFFAFLGGSKQAISTPFLTKRDTLSFFIDYLFVLLRKATAVVAGSEVVTGVTLTPAPTLRCSKALDIFLKKKFLVVSIFKF